MWVLLSIPDSLQTSIRFFSHPLPSKDFGLRYLFSVLNKSESTEKALRNLAISLCFTYLRYSEKSINEINIYIFETLKVF